MGFVCGKLGNFFDLLEKISILWLLRDYENFNFLQVSKTSILLHRKGFLLISPTIKYCEKLQASITTEKAPWQYIISPSWKHISRNLLSVQKVSTLYQLIN
jgi:hypothetical protein